MYRESPDLTRDEMCSDDYIPLFETVSHDLFWLGLTGGEPFLKEDLVDIIHLAASKSQKLHILELTTNGFSEGVVEKKVNDILENSNVPFITVGVSIDGPPLTHDYMRGRKEAWNQAIATYKKLCEISRSYPNLSPHISYTISGHNAGGFVDFLNALAEEGIRMETDLISVSIEHVGHLYHNVGSGKDSLLYGANTDIQSLLSRIGVFRSINKGIVEVGRHLFKKMFLVSAIDFLKKPNKMVIPCAALYCSCFIDPFGFVYPCSIYGKKLGNLRKTSFHRIWHSHIANKLRESIKEEKCPNCWSPCEAEPSFLLSLPKTLLPALIGHAPENEH
jgi:MoaA/NifB/PqqE/SkfB family radical SAM enzyme